MPQSHHQTTPSPGSQIPTFEQQRPPSLTTSLTTCIPTRSGTVGTSSATRLPVHRNHPVSELTSQQELNVLLPIWTERPAQARKVKSLMGRVLAWAFVCGFRSDAPDFDVVASALGAQPTPIPRPSLPYSEVPSVLTAVRGSDASPSIKLGFEFLVLTAARSGEVCSARCEEMDLERAVWTVPADRMKSRREHRVPLSQEALAVLARARELGHAEGPVFVNGRGGLSPLLSFAPSPTAWRARGSPLVPGELPGLVRVHRGATGSLGALSRPRPLRPLRAGFLPNRSSRPKASDHGGLGNLRLRTALPRLTRRCGPLASSESTGPVGTSSSAMSMLASARTTNASSPAQGSTWARPASSRVFQRERTWLMPPRLPSNLLP